MADILHKIDIDATPDKVYSAVSSNQGLKSWWTTDVSGDSEKGSTIPTYYPCSKRQKNRDTPQNANTN
jgi:hypothetical protein